MAKRIKPIKCPQCGSTKATETRTDYYRCDSCHSEFFIDNDDIHIHHKHSYALPKLSENHLKVLKFLSLGIAAFFVMIFFLMPQFSLFQPNTASYSPPVSENKPYWDIEAMIPTTDKDGQPIVIAVGDVISGNHPNQTYQPTFGFFNAKTLEEIASVPIRDLKEISSFWVFWKKMDEGKTYIVINKNRLFLLDEKTLSISEVTPQTISLPEFEKGFAEVSTNTSFENSLEITNNLGSEYYYFPKINKAFREGDFSEAERFILESPKAPQDIVRFAFSKESPLSENKIEDKFPELFKVKTQGQMGYPYQRLFLRWGDSPWDEIEGFHILTGDASRVSSFENLTPGRIYFKPEVLHFDENELLIYFKHDVAESSPYFFQVLDAKTGEVKFTKQTKDITNLSSHEVSKIKDGYLFGGFNAYILNTKEGTLEESKLRATLTQR